MWTSGLTAATIAVVAVDGRVGSASTLTSLHFETHTHTHTPQHGHCELPSEEHSCHLQAVCVAHPPVPPQAAIGTHACVLRPQPSGAPSTRGDQLHGRQRGGGVRVRVCVCVCVSMHARVRACVGRNVTECTAALYPCLHLHRQQRAAS